MSPLRPLHWQVVERILIRLGYEHYRQKGSHRIYVKSGQLMHVTVPVNRAIPVGTLNSIIKQIGIGRDEFLGLIEQVRH